MPLAFTQEDFLVKFFSMGRALTRLKLLGVDIVGHRTCSKFLHFNVKFCCDVFNIN